VSGQGAGGLAAGPGPARSGRRANLIPRSTGSAASDRGVRHRPTAPLFGASTLSARTVSPSGMTTARPSVEGLRRAGPSRRVFTNGFWRQPNFQSADEIRRRPSRRPTTTLAGREFRCYRRRPAAGRRPVSSAAKSGKDPGPQKAGNRAGTGHRFISPGGARPCSSTTHGARGETRRAAPRRGSEWCSILAHRAGGYPETEFACDQIQPGEPVQWRALGQPADRGRRDGRALGRSEKVGQHRLVLPGRTLLDETTASCVLSTPEPARVPGPPRSRYSPSAFLCLILVSRAHGPPFGRPARKQGRRPAWPP